MRRTALLAIVTLFVLAGWLFPNSARAGDCKQADPLRDAAFISGSVHQCPPKVKFTLPLVMSEWQQNAGSTGLTMSFSYARVEDNPATTRRYYFGSEHHFTSAAVPHGLQPQNGRVFTLELDYHF